jgi:hypothetical protein
MSSPRGYGEKRVPNAEVKPGDLIWVGGAGMHVAVQEVHHKDGWTYLLLEYTTWGRVRRPVLRRPSANLSTIHVPAEAGDTSA